MEKVLTWAQHSSSKGFDLDPNLQHVIEILGQEWAHCRCLIKRFTFLPQIDLDQSINFNQLRLIDWFEGSIPFKSAKQSSCLCLPFPDSNSHLAKNSLPREAVQATHGTGFWNFTIFCVFSRSFPEYNIWSGLLQQDEDILNVKSPNFSKLSKTVLPPSAQQKCLSAANLDLFLTFNSVLREIFITDGSDTVCTL